MSDNPSPTKKTQPQGRDDDSDMSRFFTPLEATVTQSKAKHAFKEGEKTFLTKKGKSQKMEVPEGFSRIEPILERLDTKMRDAERDSHEGKRRVETTWPIIRLTHQKARLVYVAHQRGTIDDETFQYCLETKLVNAALVQKWQKQGYEKLCCLQCASGATTNYGTACICRVPKSELEEDKVVECQACGCRGCSSRN